MNIMLGKKGKNEKTIFSQRISDIDVADYVADRGVCGRR